MEYTNPELPEGINTSKEHPLKDFFVLTIGLLAFVFISISILIVIVDNFADKIPFEMEKELPISNILKSQNEEPLPPYLKTLTQKILNSFTLPDEMEITFHYVNDDTVNAFATLGGHIFLYRGLIDKLKHEDELAMVIAHEIAHVKYRHPILSISHGIVVGVVLTAVSGASGNESVNNFMGQTTLASLMRFSRDYEYQADKDAINSLIKLYGNADGAKGLFNVFKKEFGNNIPFEFLATHPLTDNRISQTTKIINKLNLPPTKVKVSFPKEFKLWLKDQKEMTKPKILSLDRTAVTTQSRHSHPF
ncbi:MAG: M48 family metallopeptidase [Woeseiaceae bacterium]